MSLHKSVTKDLSPKAIKKSVVSAAAQRPLTIYPAAISVLGAAFALLIDPSVFAIGAMAAGGVLTSASWLFEYFARGNVHANRYVQAFREAMELERRAAMRELEQDLEEINDHQGLKQIQLFKDKYTNFVSILKRKMGEDELTYQRYLTMAEQVFLGGLDNLEQAALARKSVSAIDVEHIASEVWQMENNARHNDDVRLGELKARLALRENQILRAKALLLENEQALTQLDLVSAKIAEIKTRSGRAQLDLEAAMAELKHLITRAEHYSQ